MLDFIKSDQPPCGVGEIIVLPCALALVITFFLVRLWAFMPTVGL